MRPVNLIPPDERRGDSAPLRTGALIYVLLGGLALLLLAIVAVALTGKQVTDRKAHNASLQQELQQATAEAQTVQAFTDFRTIQQQRADTVTSLAQSRFDWSRVLEELARTMPSSVQLSSLKGTVSPDVTLDNGGSGSSGAADNTLRPEIAGPALEIAGCAPSQDDVAAFVASLEDIDGVTRVAVSSSKLPDPTSSGMTGEPGDAAAAGAAGGGNGDCQTAPTIAKFQIVAAFDAVATPPTATSSPSVPPSTTTPPAGSDQSPASEVASQENVTKASARQADAKAQQAIHNFNPEPGG
jgi:Tfp pilus assembly protein PilN